jgi:hypothetical protein
MVNYPISNEVRHFVNGILHTFTYPNRVNDIQGAIKDVLKSEGGDTSMKNTGRLYFVVIDFLSKHGFGHEVDYVYIIDEKGMALKECGSLEAFERKYLDPILENL